MAPSGHPLARVDRAATVGLALGLIGTLLTGCAATPSSTASPSAASFGPSTVAASQSPGPSAAASASPQGSAATGAGHWLDAGSPVDSSGEFGAIWPHLVALNGGGAIELGADNRCAPGPTVFGDGRSARLFDASTGAWAATGALSKDRGAFVMVTLDDGRVLVTGGANGGVDGAPSFSSTKIWDSASGVWKDGGALNEARTNSVGALLKDGRVFVAGGTFYDGIHTARSLKSAEIYDPAHDAWSKVAAMPTALGYATGVRLADGRALIVGSPDATSFDLGFAPVALVYDPSADAWTQAGTVGHGGPAEIVALPDGGALLLMGSAQRFDPATGRWSAVAADREFVETQAVLLPSGQVLVVGGQAASGPDDDSWPALDRADLWNPTTGAWDPVAPMPQGRQDGEMVVLSDGSVLYSAGAIAGNPNSAPSCPSSTTSAVRYVPAN
jgi:Kelch motif/Galactose oxidase, central domain